MQNRPSSKRAKRAVVPRFPQFFLASGTADKYNSERFSSGTLIIYDGPLAQLVEQLTLNQRVEGSTPSRLTRTTTGEQWVIGRNP